MPATAERSLTALCATHGWPLLGDGQSCAICARDAEAGRVVPPCPPHTLWERPFKIWLFSEVELEHSQSGTEEQRRQRTWEDWLHLIAGRHGVRPKWTTPAGELYQRLTDYHQRRIVAAVEAPR